MYWFQIILLILLYLAVIFYTLHYNKLFQPTKRIVKFEIEPTEQTIVDGISVARFVFDESRPTILFCHGNSGNVSNRNYMVKLCKMMNQNLVLFDYSGYGLSHGEPRTRRIMKDGEKVMNWTLKRVDEKNLIIWGESLGGSIASYLASKNKCSKLVLFATFASLNDLAFNDGMSYFMKAIQIFVNIFVHPLPTKDWLKNSKSPVLVVHSEDDEIISIDHARKLKNTDPNRVKLLEIKGGHASPKLEENHLSEILSFCDVNSYEVDFQECLTIFDNVSKEIWKE